MSTTPTAALTPEELAEACLKDFARNIGHGSLRERLAATIRQHSEAQGEAQRAEIERLTKERDEARRECLGARLVGEVRAEIAEAALAASQERERLLREALERIAKGETVTYDPDDLEADVITTMDEDEMREIAHAAPQPQETADGR